MGAGEPIAGTAALAVASELPTLSVIIGVAALQLANGVSGAAALAMGVSMSGKVPRPKGPQPGPLSNANYRFPDRKVSNLGRSRMRHG